MLSFFFHIVIMYYLQILLLKQAQCPLLYENTWMKGTTVDSRYLEVQGTLRNTSRYLYLNISDLQNWKKKKKSNNHISKMNM